MAIRPVLGRKRRSRVRPKRTRVVELYTNPTPNSSVICLDELGPVSPRTFPPPPSWSPGGRRIKAPLEYGRGPEKRWVYGALRVHDGQALTLSGPSRNTKGYLRLLQAVEKANPTGDLYLITDNLASHKSPPTLGSGWRPIRELCRSSSRMVRPGSTCKKHGGGCFGERPWQGRASPTPQRSSLRRRSPQSNSTIEQDPGCGVVRLDRRGIVGALLFTVFEERSSREFLHAFEDS